MNNPKALDDAARAQGFKNYDEMILFERQRSRKRETQTTTTKPKEATSPAGSTKKPTSLAGILDYVSAALGGKLK